MNPGDTLQHLEVLKVRLREVLERHPSSAAFTRDPEQAVDIFISKTVTASLNPDPVVERWLKERLRGAKLRSELAPLTGIEQWRIDGETGNIGHVSGRFFTILGVSARHRIRRTELVWDQPIIDQPEIGILGILAKKFDSVLHFCLQAKEEPGNIGSVQLSPTVQATYSNYTRAHGGTLPPFVEFFLDPLPEQVLFAKLQTEDGGRFLFKSNRNMVVLAEQEIPLPSNFIWLTLRQIGNLLKRDNTVNACTRSILTGLI